MPNPIKVVKTVTKVAGKAMRGKANSKGYKATDYQDIKKLTTGRAKAITKIAGTKQIDLNAKGLGLAKGSNKKTAKAKKELGTFDTRIQKHPLIRNTGESSAEGKYRYNSGKSIPVKKRSK